MIEYIKCIINSFKMRLELDNIADQLYYNSASSCFTCYPFKQSKLTRLYNELEIITYYHSTIKPTLIYEPEIEVLKIIQTYCHKSWLQYIQDHLVDTNFNEYIIEPTEETILKIKLQSL